jgi:hypothetical protein
MNKHHYVFLISLLFLCGTLLSCQSSKTPLQVSEHFWLGIQTKNLALVRKYSLADSIDGSEDLAQFENITAAIFGKIIIDGNVAEVETSVTILSNENKVDVKLNTYLENNNDVWKVNYRKTVNKLVFNQNMAEVLGDIQEMTEEITKQIEESVEEFQKKVVPEIKSKTEEIEEKVVPEIRSKIEQAEKELLEQLPELKNIFDEFLRELEKSLEELIPDKKESREEVKTQET